MPDAEQVDVGRDEADQPVGVAAHEQRDRVAGVAVDGELPAQGFRVAFPVQAVYERAQDRSAVVEQAHPLRRRELIVGEAAEAVVGGDELREQRSRVQHDQYHDAEQGEAVGHEAAPDELPLRGDVVTLLGGALRAGHGDRTHARLTRARTGCAGR